MTLATTLCNPSLYLYDHYLEAVTHIRESQIGAPLPQPSIRIVPSEGIAKEPFQLSVRTASIAYAAIQGIVAALETLPVLTVTIMTVLFNATDTGFVTVDGGKLERIRLATAAALASIWSPVQVSFNCALNPSTFNSLPSDSILKDPSTAYAHLVAYTVPSLSTLLAQMHAFGDQAVEQGIENLPRNSETIRYLWRESLAAQLCSTRANNLHFFTTDFPNATRAFYLTIGNAIDFANPNPN